MLLLHPFLNEKALGAKLEKLVTTDYKICGRDHFVEWSSGKTSRAKVVEAIDKQKTRLNQYWVTFSNSRKNLLQHIFKCVENPIPSYTWDCLKNAYYGYRRPNILTKTTMNNAFYRQESWKGLLGMTGQSQKVTTSNCK